MNFLRGIYLVARREYLAYVGAWGFWVSLVTTPLLLAAVIVLPVALRQAEPARYVAILAQQAEDGDAVRAALEAEKGYQVVLAPAPDIEGLKPYLTGERLLGPNTPLFAAFVVRGQGEARTLDYWSMNLTDQAPVMRARDALATLMRRDALAARGLSGEEASRIETLQPAFAQFDPRAAKAAAPVTDSDRAPFIVAIGLAVLLWSSVIGVANMLLTGVLEEKSNKILDALMTSVSPLQILAGKLLGVGCVSLTLFAAWAGFGAIGLHFGARLANAPFVDALAEAAFNPGVALIFLSCFAAGFLMYGATFLGLGSMCDSLQEAQSLLGPVFFLLIPPILLIGPAFENAKSPIVVGASWIPPFTPFVMLMRAPAGLSLGEAIGPLVLLALSVLGVLYVAGRVFRAGISHQLKIADLFKRPRPAKGG